MIPAPNREVTLRAYRRSVAPNPVRNERLQSLQAEWAAEKDRHRAALQAIARAYGLKTVASAHTTMSRARRAK
jgi:hypothetical protein